MWSVAAPEEHFYGVDLGEPTADELAEMAKGQRGKGRQE
jgi:hypothetical protein